MNKRILLIIGLLSAQAGVFAESITPAPKAQVEDIPVYTEKELQQATDEAYQRGKMDGMLAQLEEPEEEQAAEEQENEADEAHINELMERPVFKKMAESPENFEKILEENPEALEEIMQDPAIQKMMADPEFIKLLAQAEEEGVMNPHNGPAKQHDEKVNRELAIGSQDVPTEE